MHVAHVAVGIAVAGHEYHLASTIRDGDLEEIGALGVESGGHSMTIRAVDHPDLELNTAGVVASDHELAKLESATEELIALLASIFEGSQLFV